MAFVKYALPALAAANAVFAASESTMLGMFVLRSRVV